MIRLISASVRFAFGIVRSSRGVEFLYGLSQSGCGFKLAVTLRRVKAESEEFENDYAEGTSKG